VDQILARALARNPADRYASAAEFRDAVTAGAAVVVAGAPSENRAVLARAGQKPRLRWMTAGAAALATAITALAFLPRRVPPVDPKRVVVAGFENRTGDSTLAPMGDIASDYIAWGLAAARLMHDVYDLRVAASEAGDPAGVGGAAGRALAKRVGAGTVVSGRYYRDRDTLQFEAQLVDAPTGKVIVSLEPAVGLETEKTRLIETLRQRVMAGFAVVVGPEFETWAAASLPPTYEAYQEMLAARQTGFDFDAAAEHYRRAAALDPEFTGAQTSRAVVLWLLDRCAAVDSIARRLEPKRRLLPPVDRGQVDLATASCRGDTDAALDAVRTALAAAPRSAYFTVLGAVIAVEHLRPRESLEILSRLGPEQVGLQGRALGVYQSWLAMTYHMLGEYNRELAAMRGSGSALAALGRVEEAERRATGSLSQRHSPDDSWPVPMPAQCIALELRAHGHPEAARRVFERVVAWYGATGVNDATRDDYPCARPHLSAFYYTGRWSEARAGYQHRLAEDTTDLKAHAALGALAVRRGDQAEADRMDAWLATRTTSASAAYARARLAALRGDRDRAVALVRQAFELGLRGRMYLHLDPDFEPLRAYPPYRDLIRPRL
jgi:tetratricopeptide (TPR) repeat protein